MSPVSSRPEPAPDRTPEEQDGAVDAEESGAGATTEVRQARAPWHFKVIVVGSVVYLGYRLYQGIGWLVHHL